MHSPSQSEHEKLNCDIGINFCAKVMHDIRHASLDMLVALATRN